MVKVKTFFKLVVTLGLIFGLFFGMGAGLVAYVFPNEKNIVSQPKEPEEKIDGKRTNILFLGIDARPGEENSRSDSMILASIDPELNKAALISIPRDTKVEMQGHTQKICVANYLGGPQMAMKTVEELLGEKIDYYVEIDFKGFEKIVDTLGGVTLNVERRMYKPSEGIDLHPGVQKLNGHDALAFVRFRDYVMGDIERTAHQQTFLKALAGEVLKPKTIVKLPALIREANLCVDTNLRLSTMLKMASWAPGFNSKSIISQTLPGSFLDERDSQGNLLQSFWLADSDQKGKLLDQMFQGQTVAVVMDSQTVAPPVKQVTPQPAKVENDEGDRISPEEEEKLNRERSKLPSPGHGWETQG